MLSFLIGSIASGILSQVIQAKRSTRGQIFSDNLSPSCTDFGSSASEKNFALDLAYGNFTFTQAKIIDATWDTVIGQGGRLLHGWILYRCIIYPLLVLAMEISTITYPYYTSLSFSKVSFDTLLQLLKTLDLTRSYSVLLCTILLIYALGYTLLFPLIWGTATGYLSLSHKLYAMPDGDIVPLNSGNLSLCWVLDPTRSELPITTPHIEVGPNFSALLSARPPASDPESNTCLNISDSHSGSNFRHSGKYNLQYDFSGWRVKSTYSNTWESTIWSFLEGMNKTNSENFINIQRYALTRQFLQIGLDTQGWVDFGWETSFDKFVNETNELVTLKWWNDTKASTKSQCQPISWHGLYPTLRAVTLEPEELHSTQNSPVVDSRAYNESTLGIAYWSLFNLNRSVQLGPGIIPYNSTIQFDGKSIALDAPFLDIGFNCSFHPNSTTFNSLGNCVCYKGQPISLGLLSDDRAICNTAPGYVWGFSSYLARVGLILEAVWMASCLVAYPWLLCESKLLHTEPLKSAKVMRLLLDCSEAVQKDVGTHTEGLHEKEIAQKLKNIRIGYRTDQHEGKLRYRIESGLSTKGFSERHADRIFQIETKISQRAERFETALDKTVPMLNRIGNHAVHKRMNEWFDGAIAFLKSYASSGKRQPTPNEVYEDLNWRI
ncbi:hypothetical protein F4803DRAFT_571868 [Xylaria telfairii]|nr:hypothetical protein F4803DRAFT_571868 [Xylaria telfairii]